MNSGQLLPLKRNAKNETVEEAPQPNCSKNCYVCSIPGGRLIAASEFPILCRITVSLASLSCQRSDLHILPVLADSERKSRLRRKLLLTVQTLTYRVSSTPGRDVTRREARFWKRQPASSFPGAERADGGYRERGRCRQRIALHLLRDQEGSIQLALP